MKQFRETAVSPVVGVMLMLVVTIIIAAVVAAFAGGSLSNTPKTPSATIKGVFSQSGGMQIIHAGGDTIPTQDLVFELTLDPTFGTGLDAITAQLVNRSIVMDANGKCLLNLTSGLSEVDPSFKPGDALYINVTYIDAQYLQTQVAPCEGKAGSLNLPSEAAGASLACSGSNSHYNVYWTGTGYQYHLYSGETSPKSFWNLAFVNPNNVGKTFTLVTLDKRTNGVISKSTVTITA